MYSIVQLTSINVGKLTAYMYIQATTSDEIHLLWSLISDNTTILFEMCLFISFLYHVYIDQTWTSLAQHWASTGPRERCQPSFTLHHLKVGQQRACGWKQVCSQLHDITRFRSCSGDCYQSYGAVALFMFFFAFTVTLQLFSELTAKEAKTGASTLFSLQAETVQEESYPADFTVCLCSVSFDSVTLEFVDSSKVR